MYVLTSLLFLFAFLILILFSSKISFAGFNSDYLDLPHANCVKAISSVCVVIHHICIRADDVGVLSFFKFLGEPAVAVFFFLSGYGLMYSLKTKEDYLKNFFKKRICKILLPYLLMTVIYSIFKLFVLGKTVEEILVPYTKGYPVVDYSWFIVAIIILYLIFWGSFIIKNRKIAVLVFCVLFGIYMVSVGFPYWHPSLLAFPLGMVWAWNKQKIDDICKSKYMLFFPLLTLLTMLAYIIKFGIFNQGFPDEIMSVFGTTFFTLTILFVLMKVNIGNKILRFIGKISFEMYLVQGLSIIAFTEIPLIYENGLLFTLCVMTTTIVMAYMFNLFNRKILFVKI